MAAIPKIVECSASCATIKQIQSFLSLALFYNTLHLLSMTNTCLFSMPCKIKFTAEKEINWTMKANKILFLCVSKLSQQSSFNKN